MAEPEEFDGEIIYNPYRVPERVRLERAFDWTFTVLHRLEWPREEAVAYYAAYYETADTGYRVMRALVPAEPCRN